MERFLLAKVYEIVCKLTGRRYIGSTTQKYLTSRLSSHCNCYLKYKKGEYAFYTVFSVLQSGQFYINLLEQCDGIKDINDLRKRERFYIESMPCENKNIPSRGKHEWNNQKNECACGGRYTQVHKNIHMDTNKHNMFVKTITEYSELPNEIVSESPGAVLG